MRLHSSLAGACAIAALTAILTSPRACSASETHTADDLTGRWQGVTSIDSLPQPVWLTVSRSQGGSFEGLTLGYESPRVCEIQARYLKTDGADLQFATVSSTCAHSGRLSPVVVLRHRSQAVEYRLTRTTDGGPEEVGHLARAR